MARPHNLHKSRAVVPPETQEQLVLIDRFSQLPPIPGPKPWSDDVERAAVFHALQAAPPSMALCAAGAPLRSGQTWLSDEPPPGYESACRALTARLKEAEQACAASMFRLIAKAAQDPRYWTAAAWTLERKHGFVVQPAGLTGPAVVVNIGQLNVLQNAKPAIPIHELEPAIDAQAVVETSSSVE